MGAVPSMTMALFAPREFEAPGEGSCNEKREPLELTKSVVTAFIMTNPVPLPPPTDKKA